MFSSFPTLYQVWPSSIQAESFMYITRDIRPLCLIFQTLKKIVTYVTFFFKKKKIEIFHLENPAVRCIPHMSSVMNKSEKKGGGR